MDPEVAHSLTAIDPAQLGARIKAARVAAGLTQPQLAGQHASVAFLSRIESGQRRPSAELLETLATRLDVTVESLVIGEDWEDARRVELQLDHAELSLAGGEARQALDLAREALASGALASVPGGSPRARYVEAAALDASGDPDAARAFQGVLEEADVDSSTRLKSATALSRIWREQGQLDRAVAVAESALGELPDDVVASEEGIRLSVTLAAAMFLAGRTIEAAEICDRAIAESERLSSPVARASAYWNASMIRAESGDVTEALAMAKRALHLLENTERVRDLGRLRIQLAAIMLQADQPRVQEAQEQLRLADTELDWSEANPVDRARHNLVKAKTLFISGAGDEARVQAIAVLDACSVDAPMIAVEALTILGQLAWNAGERDEAQSTYRHAITLLTGVGADREAAQMWFEIGTLASEAGMVAESADAFRRAAASTGLQARLPVVTQPATQVPRTTPGQAPAGRV